MAKNDLFLKGQVKGTSMLVNKTHIASAHFVSTSHVNLKMVNGEIIEFPDNGQIYKELSELQLPIDLIKNP